MPAKLWQRSLKSKYCLWNGKQHQVQRDRTEDKYINRGSKNGINSGISAVYLGQLSKLEEITYRAMMREELWRKIITKRFRMY